MDGAPAPQDDITVVSSLAFKEALSRLAPAFSHASGISVRTIWAGGKDIPRRLFAGEVFEVVIMAAAAIDELIDKGALAPASRTDLATSRIGIAVPAGARAIDIGSGKAIKKALLAARSLSYSSGPSGVYLSGLFERWGIDAELKAKTVEPPPGVPVGSLLAEGKAEIGFQQMCELLPVPGIDVLGPLPPDIQNVTTFAAGLHVRANPGAAALLRFLTSEAAAPVIRDTGMEPARS